MVGSAVTLAGLKEGNHFDFLSKIFLKAAEQSEMKSKGTVELTAETAPCSNGLILLLEIFIINRNKDL